MSGAPTEPAPQSSEREIDVALDVYVGAVALVREQLSLLEHGAPVRMDALRRTAESIAAGARNRAYPFAIALAQGPRDDASRAVQSALLAIALVGRASRDLRTLRRTALAALLVDAGRARLAGLASIDLTTFRELPDRLDALAPTSSAALAMSAGADAWVQHSATTAFEVAHLERPRLGPLYGGQLEPRFVSRVLLTVRAFLERVAPRSGEAGRSPLEALLELSRSSSADRAVVGELLATVGLPPVGTVVALESGAWAVVAPALASSGPTRLIVLTDPNGRPLDEPSWAELGTAAGPRPVRVVGPDLARFNLARAFLAAP